MQETPKLGQLVEGAGRRDAIHVAVAPVVAGHDMDPGDRVGIRDGKACYRAEPVGIVDPFLRHTVKAGETFWLCLFPNTVTSLRHVWTHPAFAPKPQPEGLVDDRTGSV
jgi:hypothetical protein